MRKSIILMIIASLILGVFLVSCNSEVTSEFSAGDKLVEVKIAGNTKGIDVNVTSDSADNYYWYYTAVKNGGIYRSGERTTWTAVRLEKGLGTDTSLGYFSSGNWTFEFRAYATQPDTFGDNYAYSSTNSNVSVTSNNTSIPVSMTEGPGLAKASLVFDTDLTWGYTDDNTTAASATELSGRKAYMKVYVKDANDLTADYELFAKSGLASITANDTTAASAAFSGFTAVSPYEALELTSGTYKFAFKVFVTASSTAAASDADQLVGESESDSVTATNGGTLTVKKSTNDTYAVVDNEGQKKVVINSIYSEAIEATGNDDVGYSATIATSIPETPATPTNDGIYSNTKSVDATTVTSAETAVATDSSKKTSVSIPADVLTAAKVTVEKSGETVITTTESSTHTLTMDVKTDSISTSEATNFEIHSGNAAVAGIDLTMIKTTTTTTQTGEESPSTGDPVQTTVSEFKDSENQSLYLTIATYVDTNLEDVQVGYNGNKEQPRFDATNTNPSIEIARADSSNSMAGTGYNPQTGLLVFKTSHFSEFFVVCKMVAQIGSEKYPTLEAAISAAAAHDTITMLEDYIVSAAKTSTTDRIVVNKAITIDFNTHKLIVPGELESTDNFVALYIDADTTITATTGGIDCLDKSSSDDPCGVYALNVRNGATLTINGGSYHGGGTAVQVQLGKAVINEGTFRVTPYDEPYGYDFMLNCIDAAYQAGTASFEVKGGSFHNYNPENSDSEDPRASFVANGYFAIESNDVWTVDGPCVARIGSTKYNSLAAAVAAANTNDIVDMEDNDSNTDAITLSKNVTINLNNNEFGGSFVFTNTANGVTVNGEATVSGAKAIIGNSYYTDFACAYTAIPSANTEADAYVIKLLSNHDYNISQMRFTKAFTLDLNGFTLKNSATNYPFITQADFIIQDTSENQDGVFLADHTTSCALAVVGNATFTLKSGTIQSEVAIFAENAGSTINVTGGKMVSYSKYGTGDSRGIIFYAKDGSYLNISGGEFRSDQSAKSYDTMSFDPMYYVAATNLGVNATITVTGGSFSGQAIQKYVPGYESDQTFSNTKTSIIVGDYTITRSTVSSPYGAVSYDVYLYTVTANNQ